MPLRDHFRPPLDNVTSWEGFHGQWPAVIVQHLRKQLPAGYVADTGATHVVRQPRIVGSLTVALPGPSRRWQRERGPPARGGTAWAGTGSQGRVLTV